MQRWWRDLRHLRVYFANHMFSVSPTGSFDLSPFGMKSTFFLLVALLPVSLTSAQSGHSHSHSRVIDFPDTAEYLSLTCDLHMHSVFSDGAVWPDIRVQEAQRDGLDCIAITEHLEYQPHKADIPHPDRNRAFDIATRVAGQSGLIVIPGSEITRDLPHGHANSVFISDANPMLVDDANDAYAEAYRQGGFTFMNHPNWGSQRKDGVARLEPMNIELIEKGHISGIEVVNDLTYSDEALEIALEYDLTIIGTSDIHGLVDWQYKVPEGGHRPITVVLAKEKTIEGIREALFAGRTAAYYLDKLIGKEENVLPLIEASLTLNVMGYGGDTSILNTSISNSSDTPYTLSNTSAYRFHDQADLIVVPAHRTLALKVKTGERLTDLALSFDVLNVITAPNEHPSVSLSATIGE